MLHDSTTKRGEKLAVFVLFAALASSCNSGSFAGGGNKVANPPQKQQSVDSTKKNPQQPTPVAQHSQTVAPSQQVSPASLPPTDSAQNTQPPVNSDHVVPNVQPVAPTAAPVAPSNLPPSIPDVDNYVASVKVPTTCFSNMESGYQATDEGYIVQLVSGGKVVAAGYATPEAVRNGTPTDGDGAYPGMVLNFGATYVDPSITSGSGQLNICYGGTDTTPEKAQCQQKNGQFGGEGDRPTSIQGSQASWTVDNSSGKPVVSLTGNYNLATHHPVWGFVKPGACFKDYQSPIVLDLTNTGNLNLVDVWNDKTKIHFDLMANGQQVRTGWIGKGAGLLALDLNGNGKIDNGLELFGEYTHGPKTVAVGEKSFANGFEALAQYDTNGDGKIDEKDPIFSKLVVWQDLNQDGVVEKGELKTMKELGIKELSLAYVKTGNVQPDIVANNEVRLVATFKTTDGKEHKMADVWFRQRRYSDGAVAAKK